MAMFNLIYIRTTNVSVSVQFLQKQPPGVFHKKKVFKEISQNSQETLVPELLSKKEKKTQCKEIFLIALMNPLKILRVVNILDHKMLFCFLFAMTLMHASDEEGDDDT